MAEAQRGVRFEVPSPEQDRVRLGKVGIIAAVGFAIGIAWPRLAGLELVDPPPGYEPKSAAADDESENKKEKKAPATAKSAVVEEKKKEPEVTDKQTVQVGDPIITSCRTAEGKRLERCDKVDFDDVALARVKALAACDAAEGISGMLSLGVEFDFSKNGVRRVLKGKSTTVTPDITKKLLACAENEFTAVSLDGIEHQHARYIVFYPAKLVPPGELVAPEEGKDLGPQETPASGLATVSWEVALIRKEPEEGEVVARLLHGTRVSVVARLDDWYRVKYDAKGNEGWVFKGAIGL